MKIFNLWIRKPKQSPRFEGGEIVRLKKDYPDDGVKAGDCGVVWGVYVNDWLFYEASFFGADGNTPDIMFEDCEVEEAIEVIDIQQATYPERIEDFQRWLRGDSS